MLELGEEKFTIEVCNLGAEWDTLLKDRGILISELKPAYNYSSYDHKEIEIAEEIKPLSENEKKDIITAFTNIKTYLSENKPDYKEMFRSLILVLMYPKVDALNNLITAAGGDFISDDGSCMIRHGRGKQILNSSKYSKWTLKGEKNSEYNGMGNLFFLKDMVKVLDFRCLIDNEMKTEFDSFIQELKEIYKNQYGQDFEYDTSKKTELENNNRLHARKWSIVGETNRNQPYYRLDNNPDRAKGLTKREYTVIN